MNLKKRLDETIHDVFIEEFYSGKYHAGEKVDPAELAAQFSISRTPVVLALKRLTNEGILTVSNGGKYYIPIPTRKMLDEVCDVRCLLEQHAVSIHVKNNDAAVGEKLKMLAEQSKEAFLSGDPVTSVKCDFDFHRSFIELTGNSCLMEAHVSVLNRFVGIKYSLGNQLESQERAVDRHMEIMEFIIANDEKKAKESVWNHIESARQRISKCI